MRIAAIQLEVTDSEPPAERVLRTADLVRAQPDVDLVVLPELWVSGAFAYPRWAQTAEALDGPTVDAMAVAARDVGAYVHMGSFIERDGADLYNTSVLLGSDGGIEVAYRKIHLFGFGEGEPTLLTAGKEIVVADVRGTAVGLSTCYDLRFPELYRALLDAGAEVVLCVAGWPAARIEHWSILARARAIENQVVMVALNTAGTHAGKQMGGRSVVVDARGAVLAEAATSEDVLTVDINVPDIHQWRTRFPVLADRRLG